MMIKPTTLWGVITVAAMSATVMLYMGLQTSVTLSENGEEREIKTFASTVGDLLKQEQIALSDHDYVSHSLHEKLTDGVRIVYKKAKKVTMIQDGVTKEIWTTADTVREMLEEKNISYKKQDNVSVSLETSVENDLIFVFETGKQVVFKDGTNDEMVVWTVQDTLEAFLQEQNIQLSELDRVVTPTEELQSGQVVSIIRVEKKEEIKESEEPYAVVTQKDERLPMGKKQIITKGEKGKRVLTYSVLYENDKETSRTLVEETITQSPINEVVAVGSKPVVASVSRGDVAETKEFYVTATAYTAHCNGCSGMTATGINLKENPHVKVIAVDPSIIPLGTKVWVEGYGYAVAGDKGSAIKGNKIDVFFPEKSQANQWGRKKVKIRIL